MPGDSSAPGGAGREAAEKDGNPIAALIPGELAQRIAAAGRKLSLDGERRIVTILFCDIVGSTAAASQLDPENWAEIMNRAFEQMIAPVYSFEGTVARLMGDAILAFFGAPIAHEDDPLRAVRAGLEIIRRFGSFSAEIYAEWGIEINARVGINTGLVLVGQVGSDLQMEYTALGDAINLAARMEQSAAPGTLQISEETYKLLPDIFQTQDLGEISVKGKTMPIRSYRVLGIRERSSEQHRKWRYSGPLIGRRNTLAVLNTAVEATARGVGQVVFLIGEAGLGKSRLIWELRTKQQPEEEQILRPVHWYETLSYSYENSTPYAVIQRLFREIIEAGSNETAEVLDEKLHKLDAYFPEADLERVRQVIGMLLNLDGPAGRPRLAAETFKAQLYVIVADLLAGMAREYPLVLVLDDLHWIDPASCELLSALLELTRSLPILLFFSSRPDQEASGWKIRAIAQERLPHRYTEVTLDPLSDADSEHLIMELLQIDDLPETLKNQILQRAEGNPFFVEEVVRVLVENGQVAIDEHGGRWVQGESASLEIPDNIQALLTARIDRLPENSRRVLQLAALIGRTFYYRILTALLDENRKIAIDSELERLLQAQFIRETARYPEREYIFQHLLTQEAAYNTILHQHRRQYHLMVGEAMEVIFADSLEERAARLAHHFKEGNEYLKAFEYGLKAGTYAMSLFAASEALRHFDFCLSLLPMIERKGGMVSQAHVLELYQKRGRSFELTYRFADALANYEALAQAALQRGDRSLELHSLVLRGTVRSISSDQYDAEIAVEINRQALALAEELGDRAAMARVYWNMLSFYRNAGLGRQSLEAGEKSLALATELGLREQIAFTSNDLSYVYMINGDLERGIEVSQSATRLWEELGNQPMLADSLSALATINILYADFEESSKFSDRAFALSEQIRNIWGQAHSRYAIGNVYRYWGDIHRAMVTFNDTASLADQAGFVIAQVWCRCEHASMLIELGLFDEALEKLREAENVSVQLRVFVPYIQTMSSFIDFLRGNESVVIERFDYTQNIGSGAFSVSGRERYRARLAMARGRYDEALAVMQRLNEYEISLQWNLFRLESMYLVSRIYCEQGDLDAMRATQEELLSFCNRIDARWIRWQLLTDMAESARDPQERSSFADVARSDAAWIKDKIQGKPLEIAVLRLLAQRGL